MILHGFASRSSKNTVLRRKNPSIYEKYPNNPKKYVLKILTRALAPCLKLQSANYVEKSEKTNQKSVVLDPGVA